MVAQSRLGRNHHLLDHVQVNNRLRLWDPENEGYTYCCDTPALPGDFCRLEFLDGEMMDVDLKYERWRYIGNSARRVLARLNVGPMPLDLHGQLRMRCP